MENKNTCRPSTGEINEAPVTRMGAHQGVWHCFAPSSMSHSRPILTLHRCQAVGVILLRVPSSSRIAAMAKPGGWGRRALQEGAIGSGLSGRYRHPRTSRNGVDHGDRASLPRHQMAHGHRAVDSAHALSVVDDACRALPCRVVLVVFRLVRWRPLGQVISTAHDLAPILDLGGARLAAPSVPPRRRVAPHQR